MFMMKSVFFSLKSFKLGESIKFDTDFLFDLQMFAQK